MKHNYVEIYQKRAALMEACATMTRKVIEFSLSWSHTEHIETYHREVSAFDRWARNCRIQEKRFRTLAGQNGRARR